MDSEQGRQLTERLFKSGGVRDVGSNFHSKLLLAALAAGLVLVASAGVGREVVNARALAAQVEEVERARAKYGRDQLSVIRRANDALLAGELDQFIAVLEVFRDNDAEVGREARTSSVLATAELAYGEDVDLSGIREELEELERELEDGQDAP